MGGWRCSAWGRRAGYSAHARCITPRAVCRPRPQIHTRPERLRSAQASCSNARHGQLRCTRIHFTLTLAVVLMPPSHRPAIRLAHAQGAKHSTRQWPCVCRTAKFLPHWTRPRLSTFVYDRFQLIQGHNWCLGVVKRDRNCTIVTPWAQQPTPPRAYTHRQDFLG